MFVSTISGGGFFQFPDLQSHRSGSLPQESAGPDAPFGDRGPEGSGSPRGFASSHKGFHEVGPAPWEPPISDLPGLFSTGSLSSPASNSPLDVLG
jgi:hypothetical protein